MASAGLVYGWAQTIVSYSDALYYDACVDATFTANGNVVGTETGACGGNIAEWDTTAAPNVNYDFQSSHYVNAYYEVYQWEDEIVGWAFYDPSDYYYFDYYYYDVTDYGWDYWDYYNWWWDTYWYEVPDYQWVYADQGYASPTLISLGSYESSFTLPTVTISGISPGGAVRGSSGSLVISGNFLGTTSGGSITLNGAGLATLTAANDSEVDATFSIPYGANAGSHTLSVTTPLGTASVGFTVGDPTPVISSVSPSSAPAGTSLAVTVCGSGFGSAPALEVSPPGIIVTLTSTSDQQITATFNLSAAAPGSYTIDVVSGGYTGEAFVSFGGTGQRSGGVGFTVTPPPPVLQVTSNGTTLPPGGIFYIDKGTVAGGPTMPPITATLLSGGAPVTGSVSWSLSVSYPAGSNNFSPFNLAGAGSSWNVPWNNNFAGGSAVLTWSWGTYQNQTFSFSILGINPDPAIAMVQQALQPYEVAPMQTLPSGLTAMPWFLWQIAEQESNGYQQFIPSSGLPNNNPSNGNGWGLMQLDPPPNSTVIWNWQANMQAGINKVSSKLVGNGGAYNFWLRQVQQWHDWNAQNPDRPFGVAQEDDPFNCKFWMVDDQNGSPPPGYKIFADAIWIKQYNGTGSGQPGTNTGNYIVWQTPGWHLNLFDDNSRDYVHQVCSQAP